MKNLDFKPFKGLQIFCSKCKKTIHHSAKANNGCKHPPEKQKYKIVLKVPHLGGVRKTKNLTTRIYNEAVLECIKFEKELDDFHFIELENTKPELINDCLLMYADYLENEGVPEHMQRVRSSGHIYRTIAYVEHFIKFLSNTKYDIFNLKISEVGDAEVGKYYKFIDEMNQSNSTFNGRIKSLRAFYEFLISKHNYAIANPWKKVRFRPEPTINASLSKDDFEALKTVITPTDAVIIIGNTKRNMYREWIIDLIELKVFSGRRDEELVGMTWAMVYFEDNQPLFIKSPNIKVNRAKNIIREQDFEYSFIPIGEELNELLERLGMNNYRDTTEFIIAPTNANRKEIMSKIGKQFTFFFKRLNRDYSRTFKHLRKTYITMESLRAATISLQHGNSRVTEKHYIDKEYIAKMLAKSGFRVYPKNEKDTPAGHS